MRALQLARERGERAAQHLVIVAPERVARHVAERAIGEHASGRARLAGPVVHARAHTRTVPGCSCCGRLRIVPWRCM